MPLPTLKKISNKNKWQTTYDQPNNYVTIRNPASGRSLSFESGKGQEYGFGGLVKDRNVVSDINKLSGYLNSPAQKGTINPPSVVNNAPNYIPNANTQTMSDLITKFQGAVDKYNAPYDPTTDPIFQDMSKRTTDNMLQMYDRRGMGGADFAQGAMSQANLGLGLDFMNREKQNRANDIANIVNQIQTIGGLENQNYNRNIAQANNIQNAFGRYVDPNKLTPLTPEEQTIAQPYSNDFKAVIDTLPQGSVLAQILTRARDLKIANEPGKYAQYLPQTMAGQQAQNQVYGGYLGNKYQEYQNVIVQAKSAFASEIAQKELDILDQQLRTGKLDEEAKRIANKYLPQKYAAEINQANASADRQYRSGSGSGGSGSDGSLSMDEYFSKDIVKYGGVQGSGITVAQAKAALEKDMPNLIAFYGEDGYRKLWNKVLERAINAGQAKALTATPKAPSTDKNTLDQYLNED